MRKLLRHNRTQKFCLFDAETEGLSLVFSRPWQLSWITYTLEKTLDENDKFVFFEDLDVSAGAAKATGFSMSRYKSLAIPPQEVWDDFSKVLYDKDVILVGHNILKYDIYVLKTFAKTLGLRIDWSFLERCIDTRALSIAAFKGIRVDERESLLSWQMRLLSIRERGLKTSLGYLLKYFNIPHDPKKLHDGLYDSQQNIEIFKCLINEVDV